MMKGKQETKNNMSKFQEMILKESSDAKGFPQILKDLTDDQIVNFIDYLVKNKSIKELRKRQDIIVQQLKRNPSGDAFSNLSIDQQLTDSAVAIKEFKDSKPEDYITAVKNTIKRFKK